MSSYFKFSEKTSGTAETSGGKKKKKKKEKKDNGNTNDSPSGSISTESTPGKSNLHDSLASSTSSRTSVNSHASHASHTPRSGGAGDFSYDIYDEDRTSPFALQKKSYVSGSEFEFHDEEEEEDAQDDFIQRGENSAMHVHSSSPASKTSNASPAGSIASSHTSSNYSAGGRSLSSPRNASLSSPRTPRNGGGVVRKHDYQFEDDEEEDVLDEIDVSGGSINLMAQEREASQQEVIDDIDTSRDLVDLKQTYDSDDDSKYEQTFDGEKDEECDTYDSRVYEQKVQTNGTHGSRRVSGPTLTNKLTLYQRRDSKSSTLDSSTRSVLSLDMNEIEDEEVFDEYLDEYLDGGGVGGQEGDAVVRTTTEPPLAVTPRMGGFIANKKKVKKKESVLARVFGFGSGSSSTVEKVDLG